MGRAKQQSKLQVVINGRKVGELEQSPTGAVSFAYDPIWVDLEGAFAISNSLPLTYKRYTGPVVTNYFENLLPDAREIRNTMAERVGAKSTQYYDLLASVGKDCVGALQFISEDQEIKKLSPVQGEALNAKEICQLLKGLASHPLGNLDDSEFRLSLAGAQEKTALLKDRNKWYRPVGMTPTTHILKPPIGKLENGLDMSLSVENEYLCHLLAKHFGLRVAKTEIVEFDEMKCLAVERFDRRWIKGNRLLRLPQEDLCQALGVGQKYQNRGGPSNLIIMNLLNASNQRDHDRKQYFKSQLFFYLLFNTDGHAKNFSLFIDSEGFQLTPLYDILTVYPNYANQELRKNQMKLSMSVDKKYGIFEMYFRNWLSEAKNCGLNEDVLDEILLECIDAAQTLSDLEPLTRGLPQPLVDKTYEAITLRMRHLEL